MSYLDVQTVAAYLPMSAQLAAELDAMRVANAEAEAAFRAETREVFIDMVDGPRLGPGRDQWNAIMLRSWRADALRRHLDAMRLGTPGRYHRVG